MRSTELEELSHALGSDRRLTDYEVDLVEKALKKPGGELLEELYWWLDGLADNDAVQPTESKLAAILQGMIGRLR